MICFSDDIVIYVFNVHLVKFLFPFLFFLCLLPYGEIKMNILPELSTQTKGTIARKMANFNDALPLKAA